nr:MAG TPA: hypothetical protein [Bacteriophage sp.]
MKILLINFLKSINSISYNIFAHLVINSVSSLIPSF